MNKLNQLQVFQNNDFGQVRSILIDDDIWFVAKDICDCLEIEDTGKAVGRLDIDESTRIEIDHPQNRKKKLEVIIVNEPGFYSLVLGSRKSEAKLFKRWITHEVIPSIRKTGSYSVSQQIPITTNKLPLNISPNEDVLYTVAEVAKLIKTNPAYVYELIKAGLLPVLKLGNYKIRRVALLEFLQKYEGKDLTNPFNVKAINRYINPQLVPSHMQEIQ